MSSTSCGASTGSVSEPPSLWSAGGRTVTLSLATVVCAPGSVTDHRQAAASLAPLKKAAKCLSGASWVVGHASLAGHEVRRGAGGASVRAGCGAGGAGEV